MTGVQVVFLLLEQHLLRRAEHGRVIRGFQLCGSGRGLGRAALLDGVRNLTGHLGCRRALAAGVGEDVEHGQPAGL